MPVDVTKIVQKVAVSDRVGSHRLGLACPIIRTSALAPGPPPLPAPLARELLFKHVSGSALIPPPSSAVASASVDLPSPAVATVAAATIPAPHTATDESGCTQAWPYYEQSCLGTTGKSRVVRVIADDRSAATGTGELKRMRQQITEALERARGGEVHASSMPKTARSKATHVGLK